MGVALNNALKLRRIVSVTEFGAKGDGSTDDTAAIQAAIDSLPKFGQSGWHPCCLTFPVPVSKYLVTGKLSIKGHQGLFIDGRGARIEGNFADVILDIGNITGTADDMLRSHIVGLEIVQLSTLSGSGAVRARHMYTCSFQRCYMFGGRIAFELDGNANLISMCSFRNGQDSNVKTGAAANNEANTFHVCSNELSAGYGYDLSVISGVGGFTVIDGGYIENNAAGNVLITNNCKATVRGAYFNLQNGATGVHLGGTVGATYTRPPSVKVSECRITGASASTPAFINELSTTSINCQYQDNDVREGNVDLYGTAPKSINMRRVGKRLDVPNSKSIVNTDSTGAPDSWTLSGTGNVSIVASVSPYLGGNVAASISTANGYIYQTINVPANSLIRVSVWAKCSGALAIAALQAYNLGLSSQYKSVTTTSLTATKIEFYLTGGERSSAASFLLLLRNTGTGDNAQFCDIDIEDMTL